MKITKPQISHLCNQLFDRVSDLLDHFEIEPVQHHNRLVFPCPIHGGDNPEGCSIFTDGDVIKGNWKCWTRQCEEDFASSLLGFVRGVLSYRLDKEVNMITAFKYCLKFLDTKIENLETYSEPLEINKELKLLEIFEKKPQRFSHPVKREEVRRRINIPAKYYINRGYYPETLDLFDVGLCLEKNRPMSGRIVVPIYDEDYNYVGCVGRSTSPDMQPKWLHSKGFRKSYLYGLNLALEHIRKTGTVILVEGQGDVWKMHEAGFPNTVGIFGASLTDDQLVLLEQSGALNVVILTDSDEAGEKAAEQIAEKCGRRFNYYRPKISEKDVGDMTTDQIKEELSDQIQGVSL